MTKAAAVRAGQEYARALLQYQNTEAQQGRLQMLANDTDGKATSFDEKAAVFYDRLLSIKTFVVIQLRNYTCAYNYFSLSDSAVTIDMRKSILMLMNVCLHMLLQMPHISNTTQQDFATVKQELASTLAGYSSDPQPFRVIVDSADLPFSRHTIIHDLKSSDRFDITFDGKSLGPFVDMSRVRLNGVRIWLDGAVSKKPSAIIKFRVETTGLYGDITSDGSYVVFATQPLKRSFRWKLTGNTLGDIIMDSVIPEGVHIPPTPFAQWTISLQNPGDVDLTSLKSIRLEWIGTAYGR